MWFYRKMLNKTWAVNISSEKVLSISKKNRRKRNFNVSRTHKDQIGLGEFGTDKTFSRLEKPSVKSLSKWISVHGLG